MGSYSMTNGSITVRDSPAMWDALALIERFGSDMEECDIETDEAAPETICVDISISGYTSASHAVEIDDTIMELGAFAIEAARFDTEWEDCREAFYVGTPEQIAKLQSAEAASQIKELISKLNDDDSSVVLNAVIREAANPAWKREYLSQDGKRCMVCGNAELKRGDIEMGEAIAWASVECPGCGYT